MRTSRTHFFLASATMFLALGLGVMNAASNEPRSATPQEVFDGMRKNFQAEKAKGVKVRYQFDLSGPNGGEGREQREGGGGGSAGHGVSGAG